MPSNTIAILLATYNGSSYLDDLFSSLLSQYYNNFSIIARDDGSTDNTEAILRKWQKTFGERLRILPNSGEATLGFVGNFSRLLIESRASYIMFADQDDVWDKNKISLTLEAMQLCENQIGKHRPILVHTDLRVCDEDLSITASSYWKHQGIVPHRGHTLGHMIVENIAWGCTSMINRTLADLVGEIPAKAQYHDWWIALVASAFGEIVSLGTQTINWRRHASSSSEITNLHDRVWKTLINVKYMRHRLLDLMRDSRQTAKVFLKRYHKTLTNEQKAMLLAFIKLPSYDFLTRRAILLKYRLLFSSWLRSTGMILLI